MTLQNMREYSSRIVFRDVTRHTGRDSEGYEKHGRFPKREFRHRGLIAPRLIRSPSSKWEIQRNRCPGPRTELNRPAQLFGQHMHDLQSH